MIPSLHQQFVLVLVLVVWRGVVQCSPLQQRRGRGDVFRNLIVGTMTCVKHDSFKKCMETPQTPLRETNLRELQNLMLCRRRWPHIPIPIASSLLYG
jgi:hypothetical protein